MNGRDANVIVVGAGVGGLACAIDLALAGCRVTVLERAQASGGKARTVMLGDRAIDVGPTVLTMTWVFDELFESAGASFRSALPLERASILARHAWSDGTTLDLHADRDASADAIGRVFGAGEARAYRAFCEDGRRIYAIAEGPFLRAQRPTMGSIVRQFGAAGLTAFTRIDSHRSMWRALQQRFHEPRLRQLFGRYATYCGSSPFDAPATLNLIAHVEAEGVYRAKGGMHALVDALVALAQKLGVAIVHDHDVTRIVVERGAVKGVVARDTFHAADAVVFNGDVSALDATLTGKADGRGDPGVPFGARSLSAVTWAMIARPRGFPLLHHNVFFSDDYRAEFDAILGDKNVPAEPTVYVCAQDRGDSVITDSAERLLVLVNAPATGDDPTRWGERERRRCTTATMSLLERLGLTLAPSATLQTTPADFHRLFPKAGGALYGARSKGAFSALSRQGAKGNIHGLYLAGGSVHPGPGVPMAALSGRLAAAQIRADLMLAAPRSTAKSRPTVINGITSTG